MNSLKTLHDWLNSFLPAYRLNSVPTGTVMPYLTYEVNIGDLFEQSSVRVHLFYRTESEAVPDAKAMEIVNAVKCGGVYLPFDDGAIWVKAGTPLMFPYAEEDPTIKHRIINLVIENIVR